MKAPTTVMMRDIHLKVIFIPLLGILIPLVSGIISNEKYSPLQLIAANFYFILTSFVIWSGCNWIHVKLRPLFDHPNPFRKIISIALLSGLYGATAGGALTMIWFQVSKEVFTWDKLLFFSVFTCLAILVFTLIYEILFLSNERQADTKVVEELNRERIVAEMAILQNELDPHFIFNSLNTLNHLIGTDPAIAQEYNKRLAEVYKYFLVNKTKELVSLYNELEFIENYFFLLQIRHENKIQLETNIFENGSKILIPPCALQILVENAVKHNEFNADHPIKINIALHRGCLRISNNVRPKPYLVNSTKIGLNNLRSRYKLVCNRDIEIENNETTYLVKLPLISNS